MNNICIKLLMSLLFLPYLNTQARSPIKCDSIKVVFIDGLWPESDDQKSDFNQMGYFNCTLFLSGTSSPSDSLLLTTSMYAFMRPMYVTIRRQDRASIQYSLSAPAKQMLKQKWTISQIGCGAFNANLRYGVEAIACYFYPSFQESNYPNVFSLDTNFGSWIPSSDEIDYDSCKIDVTCDNLEKYLAFHSWEYTKGEQPRFCITVVNRHAYHSQTYKIKGLEFHIWSTNNDNQDLSPKFLNKLSNIALPNKDIQPISIIETNWRGHIDDKEFSMGFGFSHYIICDPTFMDDSSIIHEILHIFFPIQTDRGKGHLFISESVIEWLANYIFYGKFRNTDYSTFGETSPIPIYELTANDKNSWSQIYSEGAKHIQDLADKVGAHKLYCLITKYYTEHKIIIYEDFIKYLQVSLGKDVETMDSKVRGL